MKIIAPAAPGSIYDTMARLLGEQIGRAHGQTVLIENRTGAGGVIAAEAVSRAAPDGSVLLIISTDALIPPHLRKLNFDLITSFEPISYLVSAPIVIVVNTTSPYKTPGDLLKAARAKPGESRWRALGLRPRCKLLSRCSIGPRTLRSPSSPIRASHPQSARCWASMSLRS